MDIKKDDVIDEVTDPLDEALQAIDNGMDLTFKGSFKEAEEQANIAMQLAIKYNNPIIKVDVLNLLGINTINKGLIEHAENYFQQALNTALKENLTKLYTNCYNSMGNYYYFRRLFDLALENYYLALKYLPQSNNKNLQTKLFHNIGSTQIILGNFKDALPYLEKSLQSFTGEDDSIDKANYHFSLANVYSQTNKYKKSIDNYEKAISIYKKHDHINLNYAYCDLTYALILANRYTEALKYAFLTIELSKITKFIDIKLNAYLSVLQVYCNTDQLDKCDEFIKKVQKLLKKDASDTAVARYHGVLADYYEKINDPQKAIKHLKAHHEAESTERKQQYLTKLAAEKAKIDFESKSIEADELKKKTSELTITNELIQNQKDELIALNNSKDAILNIVSHDLNNSIGSIQPILQLLVLNNPDLQDNKFIKMIEFSTIKALSLVNDILEASHIESKNYKLDLMPFDLNILVMQHENLIITNAELKQISVEFNHCKKDLICLFSEPKFQQIFINITSNAIKFTNAKGKVHISTSIVKKADTMYACLEVKDNGIGIPKSFLPIMFNKFSKAGRVGTKGEKSTGLGMSIVKRLVELHNGFIEIESEESVGTSVKIFFPMIKDTNA
ncbi:MAG TPA: tetratricopeptide repeat-containing sensor histidine kinase [Candidatus Cloacimonadota bacterium]|nr:tetratricopeptide repeat-containing sensor histidine kinase [Candidatus Cloacimonadota bacterium]HQB41067.1 tetratricopeptide repeat-containing sensor histidine kinase [Candidatus Cloacimonadota bacterium]